MTTTAEPTNALATLQPSRLAQVTGFSDAQINLIRQTVATGASIVEVAWFLYNAKRLGLEPMVKQIYLIKYKQDQPAEIVVGIDGYRAQAEDSGCYAGSDDPIYEYEEVGQPRGAPSKATVTVWKIVQGMRVPFTASARWVEFYPGDGRIGEQYRKRPHNQLAVRAESHALRKGFPHQTEKLEAHQPLPGEWHAAAATFEVDQRITPAQQAALVARHDEIFGAGEDQSFVDQPRTSSAAGSSPPAAESQGREEADFSGPASSRRPGDRRKHLNKLIAQAKERGMSVDVQPPATDDGEDPVEVAILYWETRLENAKLDEKIVAEQQQELA